MEPGLQCGHLLPVFYLFFPHCACLSLAITRTPWQNSYKNKRNLKTSVFLSQQHNQVDKYSLTQAWSPLNETRLEEDWILAGSGDCLVLLSWDGTDHNCSKRAFTQTCLGPQQTPGLACPASPHLSTQVGYGIQALLQAQCCTCFSSKSLEGHAKSGGDFKVCKSLLLFSSQESGHKVGGYGHFSCQSTFTEVIRYFPTACAWKVYFPEAPGGSHVRRACSWLCCCPA